MRAAGQPQILGGAASRSRLCLAAAISGLAVLTACAPALVPVHEAERICANAAQTHALRPEPRMSMGVGIGSGGRVRPHAGLSVSMTPDRVDPVDTARAFEQCVMRRSGQMPTRALAGYPGPT